MVIERGHRAMHKQKGVTYFSGQLFSVISVRYPCPSGNNVRCSGNYLYRTLTHYDGTRFL